VLDIEDIKQGIIEAQRYHISTLERLNSIESNHLSGQVRSLQHSINHSILRPLEKAEMLISMIEELGAKNIPKALLDEWIEEVKTIEILTGDYADEESNS
jgi:hypothetical protein